MKWDSWIQQDILKVNDLLGTNGEFLTHTQISKKFNIRCNFLNVLQLRQSLPLEWRKVLNTNTYTCTIFDDCCFTVDINVVFPISKCATKLFYWKFINKRKRLPTCVTKWTEIYPEIDQDQWANIFSLSFKTIRETKLQTFQYRIIHRLITCKKKLYEMQLTNSPCCQYCDQEDNISHFFLLCPKVKDFWYFFFAWWNRLGALYISSIEEVDILFGYQSRENVFVVLNYCIIHAKFFIHRQKLFYNNSLGLHEFLTELKFKLQIEYNICKSNGAVDKFNKYQIVFDQL